MPVEEANDGDASVSSRSTTDDVDKALKLLLSPRPPSPAVSHSSSSPNVTVRSKVGEDFYQLSIVASYSV